MGTLRRRGKHTSVSHLHRLGLLCPDSWESPSLSFRILYDVTTGRVLAEETGQLLPLLSPRPPATSHDRDGVNGARTRNSCQGPVSGHRRFGGRHTARGAVSHHSPPGQSTGFLGGTVLWGSPCGLECSRRGSADWPISAKSGNGGAGQAQAAWSRAWRVPGAPRGKAADRPSRHRPHVPPRLQRLPTFLRKGRWRLFGPGRNPRSLKA